MKHLIVTEIHDTGPTFQRGQKGWYSGDPTNESYFMNRA